MFNFCLVINSILVIKSEIKLYYVKHRLLNGPSPFLVGTNQWTILPPHLEQFFSAGNLPHGLRLLLKVM